mmetsp:Transcript_11140/g.29926  ORF Transcript_11140/g.29926 Transcript_11140/m.29926 type:complete len:281 (-) Transcript_11140:236-1078(-)|eukprot:CAMPEP_0185840448 /NCGR_PEP_ID=MMETSP1353-20130828/16221_1 /TAXON_ID=1077150 /ORGANISM="Erythrolobus australicus, Strain CCMP3124" /LENGTH=280 /DNA_ID=CAMNT_0028539783 /DNA_START=57 /DNA_END=899 /DNA_ORIENTATION=-
MGKGAGRDWAKENKRAVDGVDDYERDPAPEVVAAALKQMRAALESKPHATMIKGFPKEMFTDAFLMRFLRVRYFEVKNALSVLSNYLEWYRSRKLTPATLTVDRVAPMLRTNVISAPGSVDVNGFRIMYMRPANYFPATMPLDELLEAAVYVMERLADEETTQLAGICFLVDMRNWGWSNFSVKYASQWLGLMQNRFPLRLRAWVMLDTPSWFGAVWRIIRPMMTARFASKWKFGPLAEADKYVSPENRTTDLDGSFAFDMEDWIRHRASLENVTVPPAH